MPQLALSKSTNRFLQEALLKLEQNKTISPYNDMEDFLATIYPIFAQMDKDVLKKLFAFRSDPASRGLLLMENFPIDDHIPSTPTDGMRTKEKQTYITEACILGIGHMLGEPIGYKNEKDGDVIQNISPIKKESKSSSNESSDADLGFHVDFALDERNPEGPYDHISSDYTLLYCLRQDPKKEATTKYIEARDICDKMSDEQIALMRSPIFECAAPYTFTRRPRDNRLWSKPTSIIKGPQSFPEISVDTSCGVRGINEQATQILEVLKEVCALPDIAYEIHLKPGDILILNGRKGVHARSPFKAFYDGNDRWLHRVYVRRSLWELRKDDSPSHRVF